MKLLREYINLLLIESRISDVKAKYPELDIEALISFDPTSNNKYLAWIAKQADKGHSSEDIAPTVSYFHRNNQRFAKKDINFYNDLKDLENEVKRLSQLKTSKEKKVEAKSGAEIIYNDEEVTVRYIGTKAACQQYGQGTKWCITMKDASYFEQYTGANTVFYYIFRNEPLSDNFDKVAAAVKRDKNNSIKEIEYFDAADFDYATLEFDSFNEIESEIKKHALTAPKADLAKLLDGELKGQAVIDVIDLYRDDKEVIDHITGGFYEIEDPQTLAMLATDKLNLIRIEVASNPSTPPEILQVLAEDESNYVRKGVASNPSTPQEVLQILADDEGDGVKINVAGNQSTPQEVLQILADDEDQLVKMSVASNKSAPLEALQVLAEDENWHIRASVAENPSTPPNVLQVLADECGADVRSAVAKNQSTPPEVLQILAEDESNYVRECVAKNQSTPPEVLQILADYKDWNVKMSVARNPSTPAEVLLALAEDKSEYVRQAAQRQLDKRG